MTNKEMKDLINRINFWDNECKADCEGIAAEMLSDLVKRLAQWLGVKQIDALIYAQMAN